MFAAGCKGLVSVKAIAAHRWLYEYLIAPLPNIRVTHTYPSRLRDGSRRGSSLRPPVPVVDNLHRLVQ
jgi:hypothetical protein